MLSPYRLAGEMPRAPRPARVAPVDLEDDVDSAVACHHVVDECEIARDDGFPQYLAVALAISFGMLAFVLLVDLVASH